MTTKLSLYASNSHRKSESNLQQVKLVNNIVQEFSLAQQKNYHFVSYWISAVWPLQPAYEKNRNNKLTETEQDNGNSCLLYRLSVQPVNMLMLQISDTTTQALIKHYEQSSVFEIILLPEKYDNCISTYITSADILISRLGQQNNGEIPHIPSPNVVHFFWLAGSCFSHRAVKFLNSAF